MWLSILSLPTNLTKSADSTSRKQNQLPLSLREDSCWHLFLWHLLLELKSLGTLTSVYAVSLLYHRCSGRKRWRWLKYPVSLLSSNWIVSCSSCLVPGAKAGIQNGQKNIKKGFIWVNPNDSCICNIVLQFSSHGRIGFPPPKKKTCATPNRMGVFLTIKSPPTNFSATALRDVPTKQVTWNRSFCPLPRAKAFRLGRLNRVDGRWISILPTEHRLLPMPLFKPTKLDGIWSDGLPVWAQQKWTRSYYW